MAFWALLALTLLAMASNAIAKPRIGICFFGLTRSLQATAPMILQRVIRPLKAVATVTTFLHTYNLTQISNARSNEKNAPNNVADLHLVEPDVYQIDDQSKFLASLPAGFCRQKGDAWGDRFQSHRNFMCQLNSLAQVTKLVSKNGSFDAIVFVRPDMFYFTAIDAQQVLQSRSGEIYLPPFANWDGANDRFAFGAPSTMMLYGNRQSDIAEYCKTHPAHSERFLKWFLSRHNLTIRRTPLVFGRVRAPKQLWEMPSWRLVRVTNKTLDAALEHFI
jgi:hypothetical protein